MDKKLYTGREGEFSKFNLSLCPNKIVLKVFEAFAGYGSQHLALKYLSKKYNFRFEVVGICEINPDAVKAYKALHGEVQNFGDISREGIWNEVPDFDVFFYTFPCQDLSWTGLKKGFEEGSGTRSSLVWECRKAIAKKRPKYLLMENVKSITFDNRPAMGTRSNLANLQFWINTLKSLGYTSTGLVMNSFDYNVPQHRERYILISVLGEQPVEIVPPEKISLPMTNFLERNVPQNYYLKVA